MSDSRSQLITKSTQIRVSSTLDKSVGKKFLTDGSSETCWTSQQGLPQYIHIAFDSPVYPEVINLTFQGGFAGKRCSVLASPLAGNDIADSENLRSGTQLTELCTIYPEDVNRKQTFEISECPTAITLLRIVFEESSDLFGRITIYDLQIEGRMEK